MKKPRDFFLLLTLSSKIVFLLLVLTERSLTIAPPSDTIPPQVSGCPDDITKVVPPGSRSNIRVDWMNPSAKDNSGSDACVKNMRTLYPYNGKNFPPNTTTPIKYIFSDCPQQCREQECIGNEAFCSFNVIIKEEFECDTVTIVLEDPSFSPTPQSITSPFYPMEYPTDSSCQWLVRTSSNSHSSANHILVSIKEIQLQLNDALLISGADPQEAVTYRGRLPQRVLLFQGAEIDIRFQSGSRGVTVYRGFSLEVVAVVSKDKPSWCNDAHGYQCRSSLICIDEGYLCDGISDCPQSDDENNCSRCNDIQSLPFNMTFDSNDVISMMSEPLNLSTSNIEWCFSSASGYNIVIDFPLPGDDYLVMQDPTAQSNQDTVIIERRSMTSFFSLNLSSLWVRWYPGIDGQRASFSISVNGKLDEGHCDSGYQCRNSHVCTGRQNDCDGVLDCPLGEEEMTCERRRCPGGCHCIASLGSFKVEGCNRPWTPVLSKSAPVITTSLSISGVAGQDLRNITSGFFKGLSNLNNLEIISCPVENIWIDAFEGLEKLQSMYLGEVDLRRTYTHTFSGLPNLVELTISNKLEEMEPGSFQGLIKLTKLMLNDNKMSTLPSGLFNSLSELTLLDLGKNSLSHLPADVFVGLHNLQKLKLYSNRLHSFPRGIFQELLNVEEIEVTSNRLRELPGETFSGLHNLRKIVLQYNNLTYFSEGFLTNFTLLEGIYCRNNSIGVIQPDLFHGLFNLSCIDLRNNLLTEIPKDSLRDNKELAQLYLAGNKISSLDPNLLEGLSKIEKLELEDNRIKSLHTGQFRHLSSLKSLYISNNKLAELRNGTFLGLQSVSDLSLSVNKIAEIEPGTFQGLENLATLDLSNNTITVLEEGSFQGLSSLDYLYLSGNPLREIHPSVFDIFKHLKVLKTDDHAVCCFVDSSTTFCDVTSKELRPPYLTCEDHRLLSQDVMKAFIWLQVILAITGNFLVLVWRGSKLKGSKNKPQMLLILNLAASDFLMGLYLLIIAAVDLYYGNNFLLQTATWRSSIVCRIAGVIGLVSSEASVFLVTLISFDRFMGVVFFMSRFRLTTRVTVKVLAALWFVAVGVSAMASALSATSGNFYELSNVCLGLPLSTKPANYSITITNEASAEGGVLVSDVNTFGNKPAWIFPIVVFLGINLLSFILILIFYILIFIYSKTSAKKSQRPEDKEKELKLAVKMLFIVGTDFACWVPVIIMGILTQSGLVQIHQTMYAWAVILILPINSAINPWLYTLSYTSPSTWRMLCTAVRRRPFSQTFSSELQAKK